MAHDKEYLYKAIIDNYKDKIQELKRLVKEKQEAEDERNDLSVKMWGELNREGNKREYSNLKSLDHKLYVTIEKNIELIDKLITEL